GAPVDLDARRVDDDVVDTRPGEPSVQPPAVTACFVAAVHDRLPARVPPDFRLGDANRPPLPLASANAVVAHPVSAISDADVPSLDAQLQAHVQVTRLGRKLVP